MKLHFIEAKAKIGIDIPDEMLKEFPDSICVAAATQFVHKLPDFLTDLQAKGKKTTLVKGQMCYACMTITEIEITYVIIIVETPRGRYVLKKKGKKDNDGFEA